MKAMNELDRIMNLMIVIIYSQVVYSTQYIVYPLDRYNGTLCLMTANYMVKHLGSPNLITYHSSMRKVTEFWLVNATESQRHDIMSSPGVSECSFLNSTAC